MATGRTGGHENPLALIGIKPVLLIRDMFCGFHHGQRSSVPRKQAGYMTAPDFGRQPKAFFLAFRGPSIHDDDGSHGSEIAPGSPSSGTTFVTTGESLEWL